VWGGEALRSNSSALPVDGAPVVLGLGAAEVVGGVEGEDSSSEECTNSEDSGARLLGAGLGWLGRVEARRSRRTEGAGLLSWGLSLV